MHSFVRTKIIEGGLVGFFIISSGAQFNSVFWQFAGKLVRMREWKWFVGKHSRLRKIGGNKDQTDFWKQTRSLWHSFLTPRFSDLSNLKESVFNCVFEFLYEFTLSKTVVGMALPSSVDIISSGKTFKRNTKVSRCRYYSFKAKEGQYELQAESRELLW